jgi:5,10-methylenetetrahydromethanopterin reductase
VVAGGLRLHGSWSATRGQTDKSATDMAAIARQWEDDGYDYVPYGDTTFRDCYVCLGAIAAATTRAAIGTYVTNPSTRSPLVTAQAIASVDEVSGGRAFLGIGMGNSANAINGMSRATPDSLRRALDIINSAFREARNHEAWPEGLKIDESVNAFEWIKRRVPILVAARAPMGQRIAAEVADGLMLRAGDVPHEQLPGVISRVLQWREEGPRAGDPLEIQILDSAFIGDPEKGRRYLGSPTATRARAMNPDEPGLDAALRAQILEYQKRYDFGAHGSSLTKSNIKLLYELEIADYMFDRYAFIGDEAAMVTRFEELEDMGVTATHAPDPWREAASAVARYRDLHPLDPEADPSPLRPKPHLRWGGSTAAVTDSARQPTRESRTRSRVV